MSSRLVRDGYDDEWVQRLLLELPEDTRDAVIELCIMNISSSRERPTSAEIRRFAEREGLDPAPLMSAFGYETAAETGAVSDRARLGGPALVPPGSREHMLCQLVYSEMTGSRMVVARRN